MAPPKWFWIVLAACIVAYTGFNCWNIWIDNMSRVQSQAKQAKDDAEQQKRLDELQKRLGRAYGN